MKGPHEHALLDINNLIHKVLELTQNEITGNHISLRTNLAADLPLVRGDPRQLQQVLINLVTNSIHAMRGVTNRPRELSFGRPGVQMVCSSKFRIPDPESIRTN